MQILLLPNISEIAAYSKFQRIIIITICLYLLSVCFDFLFNNNFVVCRFLLKWLSYLLKANDSDLHKIILCKYQLVRARQKSRYKGFGFRNQYRLPVASIANSHFICIGPKRKFKSYIATQMAMPYRNGIKSQYVTCL